MQTRSPCLGRTVSFDLQQTVTSWTVGKRERRKHRFSHPGRPHDAGGRVPSSTEWALRMLWAARLCTVGLVLHAYGRCRGGHACRKFCASTIEGSCVWHKHPGSSVCCKKACLSAVVWEQAVGHPQVSSWQHTVHRSAPLLTASRGRVGQRVVKQAKRPSNLQLNGIVQLGKIVLCKFATASTGEPCRRRQSR